ncbi:MAG: ABC transporter ATP-binding protein [Chloroflexi bacterium]|nr:ABC transporter ATP-binding protein [Chloroflexota bacterium]
MVHHQVDREENISNTPKSSDRILFRRLFFQSRPFWPHIAGIFLLGLLSTPLVLLNPVPLKIAVDSVVGSEPMPGLLGALLPDSATSSTMRLLAVVAGLQLLIVLLSQLNDLATYMVRARAGEGMVLDFRARLFRHVQRLSLLFHDTRGTADSLYRIQRDAPSIREVTLDSLVSVLSSTVMLVVMVYVIIRIDWQLALVALAVSPFLFILARMYNKRMRPQYRAAWRMDSAAIEVVQEVLAAFRVVKAFGREDSEQDRFVRRADKTRQARIKLGFAEGAFGLLINMAIAIGTAAVLFIGIRNVQSGVLTLGELLVVLAYVAQLYAPLRNISRQTASLQSSLASAERAFELMDEVPDVVDSPNARPLERASGEIEFRNVSFAYPSSPEEGVLRNVSFRIAPGTRLGIAGRTGVGKTTLASLVTRFYDPSAGQILLDGVDIKDYRLADLRNQFAIVLQEPVLFSTSIAENISYARPSATQKELEDAASAANVHDFIAGLPEGYQTLVGERGMKLSGGERQRIALARAFLKDAPILILDEPTSSVDMETEAGIMEAMERLMSGRTTLMIAHRLSTLDICDARIDIERGSIVSASGNVELEAYELTGTSAAGS